MWSRHDAGGGITFYYYHDAITWIAVALAVVWLTWFLVSRYRRARSLRRRAPRVNNRSLKRIIEIKNELSQKYLPKGVSNNIHAVGIGMTAGEYCIQIFVNDAKKELWSGSGSARLPDGYQGVLVVIIQMRAAILLAAEKLSLPEASTEYRNGIRGHQEVIIGGISGANTNLAGQSGTIGYFCKRKSRFLQRTQICMVSNSHVFADLQKATVDDGDLIMQPSPGEPGSNRPIGTLINFSPLKFDGDIDEPNHIDAAVAQLWGTQVHKLVLPFIGAVKGYVPKADIRIGEPARKCGRTTGYTEGCVFSTCLDIWIKYDRTQQSAFFQNQILIEPASPRYTKFVEKGDSGSFVVDEGQHALGLIFAGAPELPESMRAQANIDPGGPQRIEGYGVANPISEVLERMKIDLLL